ncbi:7tm 6 domain containing protein, partial [Asbolus verrucosus]
MISNKEDYFGVLIKSYNLSGLRYSSKTLWNYISRFVLFPISLIFHLMTIYNLRYKNDIFEITEVFDAISLSGQVSNGVNILVKCEHILQVMIRKLILILHSRTVDAIIQDRSHFWKYDEAGKDMGNELQKQKKERNAEITFRMHEKINTVFSEFFAFEFLLNVLSTSIQFYILSDSSSSSTLMIRSLLMIIVIITQNTLIYIPASNIEVEAENLVNEIYNIDWYNTNNSKISTFIIFWLMNAQKIPRMTGIGLLYVTRDTYLR